jgi:ribonuclease R
LKEANILKNLILDFRKKNGNLDFDIKETYIKIAEGNKEQNEELKVIAIEEYPKYDSNKMIEAFMVSANEAVAKKFSIVPFLYRVHEKPSEEDILELNEKLNLFGVKFQVKENNPNEFMKLLDVIEQKAES